jgi:anthranilate phosphoribosyltransferase
MKAILTRLFNHEELTSEETKQILLNITKEMYPEAQIAALLTAFQMRSITVDELIGFREALMETRLPIDFAPYRPIDIVGTGGDGKNTFNISTCACFVVAGAGYKVAKHGNYGATSVSGASNVIEQHGVRFTNNPDTLKRSMEECNIAYLHAQLFNPAMKFVGPVRKTLGVRTLFNLLGPLVNPCCPGINYSTDSQTNIMVLGNGEGAVLYPVIEDGKLTDVIIESPGSGYTNVALYVQSLTGSGAEIGVSSTNGDILSIQSDVNY